MTALRVLLESSPIAEVLGRFESVQDVLVMCLVRMLGCGNRQLGIGIRIYCTSLCCASLRSSCSEAAVRAVR